MFLRVVRAAGGGGVKHEYVRVVEAYRDNGKIRHRTVVRICWPNVWICINLLVCFMAIPLMGRKSKARMLVRWGHGIGVGCWWHGIFGANLVFSRPSTSYR